MADGEQCIYNMQQRLFSPYDLQQGSSLLRSLFISNFPGIKTISRKQASLLKVVVEGPCVSKSQLNISAQK